MLLRLLALIARIPTYEAVLMDSTFEHIWSQLKSTQAKDKKLTLYAAATFDHELLAAGIHTWLLRRWNSFNVATHSIVALLLAHVLAPIFSIPQVWTWWASTAALVAVPLVNALFAWRETMRMIEFQSYRQQRVPSQRGESTSSGSSEESVTAEPKGVPSMNLSGENHQKEDWSYHYALHHMLAHWAAFLTIFVLLVTLGVIWNTAQTPRVAVDDQDVVPGSERLMGGW
jgi:hypothetical protein